MRFAVQSLAAAALALACMASTQPARAQADLAWCAIYNDALGGATSCSFVTLDQCRATVSGVGGHCIQNPRLSWPTNPATGRPQRR